jgi:hypothetical protein
MWSRTECIDVKKEHHHLKWQTGSGVLLFIEIRLILSGVGGDDLRILPESRQGVHFLNGTPDKTYGGYKPTCED